MAIKRRKLPRAKTVRDGRTEMNLANARLERELPTRLRGLIPVPSPGRAGLVNHLYDSGGRGAKLNYAFFDDYWDTFVNRSSSICLKNFSIFATEEELQMFMQRQYPVIYDRWKEPPGTLGWPHEPCIAITLQTKMVTFFDRVVVLASAEFNLLSFIVDHFKSTGDPVTLKEIRDEISCSTNLAPILSVIRKKFHTTAKKTFEKELQIAAMRLLKEGLLPVSQRKEGYYVKRPELYHVQ